MELKFNKRYALYFLYTAVFGLCFGRLFIVYGIGQTPNNIMLLMYFVIFIVLLLSAILSSQRIFVHGKIQDELKIRSYAMIIYFTINYYLLSMTTEFFVPFLNMTLSLMIFIGALNCGKKVKWNFDIFFKIGTVCFYVLAAMFIYSRIHGFTYFYSLVMAEYYAQFQNSIYYVLFALLFPLLIDNKLIRYSSLLLTIVCVLMSFKTTSLLAVAIGLLFYLQADSFINREKYSKKKVLNKLSLILLLIVFVSLAVSLVGNRFGLTVLDKISISYETGGSGRLDIYQEVISKQFNSKFIDWVFGHGYDSVNTIVGMSAHNDFLEILFDFGIIGFYLYFSFIIYIFKHIRKMRSRYDKYYPCMLMSFVFFVVLSSLSHLFQIRMYGMILMLFWGLMISLDENIKTNNYMGI